MISDPFFAHPYENIPPLPCSENIVLTDLYRNQPYIRTFMDRRHFLFTPISGNPSTARNALATPPHAERTSLHNKQQSGFDATPSLERYDGPWTRREALHLLRRTVLAPSVRDLAAAIKMDMDTLVARLTFHSTSLPAPPRFVGEWLASETTFFDSDRKDLILTLGNELRRWWCGMMIDGGLSVRERMTLFWHNHFPIDATLCPDPRYMYMQNQLYRRFALGNFRQLVREVSVDKAMLYYLDGKLNKKGKEVNENYARELQELFTIGAIDNDGKPNYTQQDIYEAARALTGWGFWGAGITGDVSCPPWFGHDPTDKVVYGRAIKGREFGEQELDDLLDIIFDREETPRYIVRKLYRFFVHTDALLTPFVPIAKEVEENIIIPLAAEFRSSNWNIAHVLRRLFSSRHFYDAQVIGSNIKSPIDLFVGTARALSSSGSSGNGDEFLIEAAHISAKEVGQWLFMPPGVQGWQFYRSWISSTTLPMRHMLTDRLVDGMETFYYDVSGSLYGMPESIYGNAQLNVLEYARQFPPFADDPIRLIEEITEHLLAYPASPRLLGQLRDALLQGQPAYEWGGLNDDLKEFRLKGMMKFLMRSANYQLM